MKKMFLLVVVLTAITLSNSFAFAYEKEEYPEGYRSYPDFIKNFQLFLSDDTEVSLMTKSPVEYNDDGQRITYIDQEISKSETIRLRANNEDSRIDEDSYYVDGVKTEISINEDGFYHLANPENSIRLKIIMPGKMIGQTKEETIEIVPMHIDEAKAVIDSIDNLKELVSLEDKETIASIRAAYNALAEEDKARVTNYDKLVAAEARIADLEKAAEFDEAVGTLPDLDNLTEADYEKIADIKGKYDALTDEQKKLVSNEAALKLAFEKLAVKTLQDELNEAKRALNEALENETPESDINKLVEDVKQTKEDLKDAKDNLEVAEATLKVKSTIIKKVKAKAQKKKTTVTWKSAGSGYKYEVYKSLKVSGGYKRAATSSKAKVVIKKLKSKKTYYVKVRGFKTINGKKVYTQFSDAVSVKIK